MKLTELITHATKLEILLSKKMQSTVFAGAKKDVEQLSVAIHSYIDYLNRKKKRQYRLVLRRLLVIQYIHTLCPGARTTQSLHLP